MLGPRLSHYEILAKVGDGGMGVVYKARDTHLDRFVAIKTLSADTLTDPERRGRFSREAKAASALNHPGIITIHDIATEDGIDFIAMEYVPGKTLDQLIGRKGLSLKDTRLCLEEAQAMGVPLPMGDVLVRLLERTAEKYGGDSDFTAMAKIAEEDAGLDPERGV